MGTLSLVYFAWVRDAIGLNGEAIDHPGPNRTVADVVGMLAARGGGYAQAFAEPERLRAALDQQFVRLSDPLGEGRELALFPPVTGG